MANGTEETDMYGLVEDEALRQRVEKIQQEVATYRLRHGEHQDRGASEMIETAITGRPRHEAKEVSVTDDRPIRAQ
jgi:hypothetical protein